MSDEQESEAVCSDHLDPPRPPPVQSIADFINEPENRLVLTLAERESLANSLEPNDIVCLRPTDPKDEPSLWRCAKATKGGRYWFSKRIPAVLGRDDLNELTLIWSVTAERLLPIPMKACEHVESILKVEHPYHRIRAMVNKTYPQWAWKLQVYDVRDPLLKPPDSSSQVRPGHYGGPTNPHEPIKIIEHYGLNFSLGNAIKYILRAGKKDEARTVEDLEKARTYLDFEIARLRREKA